MEESLLKILYKPNLYKAQISLLQQNERQSDPEAAITIRTISLHQRKISKMITKLLVKKNYQPRPVQEREIRVKDKYRMICKLDVFDHIVQGALCNAIMPRLIGYLTQHIYSFKHKSNYLAAREFAHFVRQHQNKRKLDLFVIRTDVKSYTDSIPIHEDSPLWEKLNHLFAYLCPNEDLSYWIDLIKQFLRPIIIKEDGQSYQRLCGLPMGSPLGAIIALIYLNDLDITLSKNPNTFYARYGDDILISHPSINTINTLDQQLRHGLNQLGLNINPDKHQLIYLSRSGAQHQEAKHLDHSQKVSYLGFNIDANGTIGLKLKSQRILLKDIMERIHNLNHLYKAYDMNKKGELICAALNSSFKPGHPLINEKLLIVLNGTTDRRQLKQLDFMIALRVAEVTSGIFGVKAFRKSPYRHIRQQWKLQSLCQLRNQRYQSWKR